MTSFLLRATHLISSALYLLAGVILLGFGFFDPMLAVFLLAMVTTWVFWLPVVSRRTADDEYDERSLNAKFDAGGQPGHGLPREAYVRVRSVRLRRRIRRRLGISTFERRVLDFGIPLATTFTWLLLITFLSIALSASAR